MSLRPTAHLASWLGTRACSCLTSPSNKWDPWEAKPVWGDAPCIFYTRDRVKSFLPRPIKSVFCKHIHDCLSPKKPTCSQVVHEGNPWCGFVASRDAFRGAAKEEVVEKLEVKQISFSMILAATREGLSSQESYQVIFLLHLLHSFIYK